MNKVTMIIVGAIIAILVLFGGTFVSEQNAIVALEEKVNSGFANIGTQLERRADLIPNLVATVKGFTSHEEDIIQRITEAREKMSSASSVSEMSAADAQLNSALRDLNVIVENYPELKSSENFINLQDELAGTENRITTARKEYNEAVKEYNTKIKSFPASIIANWQHKEEKEYYEVSEDKTEVPIVDFSD